MESPSKTGTCVEGASEEVYWVDCRSAQAPEPLMRDTSAYKQEVTVRICEGYSGDIRLGCSIQIRFVIYEYILYAPSCIFVVCQSF